MDVLVRLCIIVVAAWLAVVFGRAGIWLGSIASIGFGLLWLIGRELRRTESAMGGLILFTGLAVVGLYIDLASWAMLLATVATLATWNLQLFETRLFRAGRVENRTTLQRLYLERLSIISALSLVLGGLGLGVELRINLVVALGLGGLAVLLLARILRQH